MGVLESAGTLSYGIDVITPDIVDSPAGSISLDMSSELIEARFECLEERELPSTLGVSNPPLPSYLLSTCRSLWSFRPKNDFPPEDCLDLSAELDVEGMVTVSAATGRLQHETDTVHAPFPSSRSV
jgi:hypothetical protein